MSAASPYGERLVPRIVDDRAREEPFRVVYLTPISSDVTYGFRELTAKAFASAVDKVSWWLESELGRGIDFPTVAYIGPHDLRYVILTLACIKTGYKALLTSPRNGLEAQLSLLDATNCSIWISPAEKSSLPAELEAQRSLKELRIATLDDLLKTEVVAKYPYNKTFEEAASEPFCMLHSSGSTANPKPIPWKHSTVSTLDATRLLPEWEGCRPWTEIFKKDDRLYSAFPFFHGAGAIMNTLVNAFHETCNVIGPAFAAPTLSLIDSLLDCVKIDRWSIIPSIVDEIGENEAVYSKFDLSQVIIASGGPVNYASANKATKSVRIINITGLTEGLFMGILLPAPEDWIYFVWHPYANFEFVEIESGLFEHFAVRDEELVSKHQGLFHTFSDVSRMSLKDIYEPHASKPGHWIYKGRTDDMVVLSSGEKAHPVGPEAIINQHPAIRSSLMIGMAHPQAGLLVELEDPSSRTIEQHSTLLDSVYETVKLANATVQSFARIHKDFILFAKPEKPFPRTDKGTVKRRMTWQVYEEEIKQFYAMLEGENISSLRANIDFASLESTRQTISELVVSLLPTQVKLRADDNFIEIGVDSLVTAGIARALRHAAEIQGIDEERVSKIRVPLFYLYPSINSLGAQIHKIMNAGSDKYDVTDSTETLPQQMRTLREKYTANLPPKKARQSTQTTARAEVRVIMMTGTTGFLGSYILDNLLRESNVKCIYCLNRGLDGGKQQQAKAAEDRGLQTTAADKSVQYLQADLAQPLLALPHQQYEELVQNVTDIIHLAWPVNFNFGIKTFEPQLQGVRNLVNFCLQSAQDAAFMFVSTVAAIHHLRDMQPIPEAATERLPIEGLPYAASKQVAELIMYDAFEQSGVNASVCRVGQICGPVLRGQKGMWALEAWVPTIIESSQRLGVLPLTFGSYDPINWTPVDLQAKIIVELTNNKDRLSQSDKRQISVYHATNPSSSSWSGHMLPTVHRHFPSLKLVPWSQWVTALSAAQSGPFAGGAAGNMGLRLLDFFEKIKREQDKGYVRPSLDTSKTQAMSVTMTNLKAVGPEWTELWLQQWGWK